MTAANNISSGGIATPPVFKVKSDTFRRFQTGRAKFERWSKYLDLADSTDLEVYNYAKKNSKSTIYLQDADTGALRAIRRKCVDGS